MQQQYFKGFQLIALSSPPPKFLRSDDFLVEALKKA